MIGWDANHDTAIGWNLTPIKQVRRFGRWSQEGYDVLINVENYAVDKIIFLIQLFIEQTSHA